MGLMRFVFPPGRITEQMAREAYLSGFDRIPWPIRCRRTETELVLERSSSDSGNLHIPWDVDGHGQVTLSTGTLMEREAPYHLPLELARGKLCQLRNQMAEWQGAGLVVPQEVLQELQESMGCFSRGVILDHGSSESAAMAEQSIRATLDAADLLAAAYTRQALASRRRVAGRYPVFLGADLGAAPLDDATSPGYLETFNAANVPLAWRDVETGEETYCWDLSDRQIQWCRAHGLMTSVGPLVQLDEHALPDWLALYEEDFEAIFAFSSEFVQRVVDRYHGQVDLWQCAGRVNTGAVLSLAEEERVKLTARAVELTRSLDPNTPVAVSFDQPWGEYLGKCEMDFPPLHFADALLRANLGLSALVLEINVGYQAGGSLFRDPLEFNRLLDYWSLLGLPIYVSLRAPSAADDDPLARKTTRPTPHEWTSATQRMWVERYVPLLLSKPIVQGVIWGQLRDSQPHDFAHGGLLDRNDQPKPALRQLAAVRGALNAATPEGNLPPAGLPGR